MPIGSVKKALVAEVGVDLSSFKRGMRRANRLAGRAGRGLKTAFKAAGAAAAAMGAAITAAIARGIQKAAEFQGEMRRLQTLVGVGTDQMGEFRDSILRLAPAVGKGPRELSKALFAITSGGLEGAQAMRTLEASAKASAIGLGNMTQIGRTATAALQAFGDEGLTAQGAVDQMVATVREGNIEASELTGALGKVIGMADAMGVSFAEMNAFVATFTRLGVEARIATTSLRATLSTLAKPSTEQRETFQELGTSVRGFRQEIQQKGLAQALRALIQRSQGNIETMSKLIPNVRALAGVLGTAGSQGESFSEIQKNIRESMGLTSEGFQQAKKDLNLLIARIKAAKDVLLIRVGEQFAPFVQRFLGDPRTIKAFADAFIFGVRAMVGSLQALLKAGRRIADSPVGRILGIETPTSRLAQAQDRLDRLRELRASLQVGERETVGLAGISAGLSAGAGLKEVESQIDKVTKSIDKKGGLKDQFLQADQIFKQINRTLDEMQKRLRNIATGRIARSVAGGAGGGGSGAGGGGAGFSPARGTLAALGLVGPGRGAFGTGPGPQQRGGLPAGRGPGLKVMQRFVNEQISAVLTQPLGKLGDKGQSTAEIIGNTLIPAFSQLGALMGDTASQMLNAATQIASSIARIISSSSMSFGSFGGIATLATGVFSAIGGFFQSGGMVGGRGAVPIVAHGGEGVLTQSAVQAIGGPNTVRQINRQAGGDRGGGVVDAAADRGSGGGGRPINLTINASGGGRSAGLMRQIRDALEELDRRGDLPF